jgi:dolichyl-phosphate beta-glucosyltransferase
MSKRPKRKKVDLSIVIPALNEEKRIGATLDELAEFLRNSDTLKTLRIEVIVVSADSSDHTHEIALTKQKLFDNFKLLKPGPKVGKGRDVQYGMLRAQGDSVLFMDADLATPLRFLPIFYKAFLKGDEVIIGTRNLRRHHTSPVRIMLSNAGNLLFRIAAGLWVEDSQCGFKMFSQEAAQVCFQKLKIMKWGFDMEILAIAKANNYKIKTYRIKGWKAMPHSTFTEGFVRNVVESLWELAHIFWRRLRGFYRA